MSAMHPRISINTLCLAPAPLREHVGTVARLGAAGIVPDLAQLHETGIGEATALLRGSGLTVAAITHRAFAFAAPADAANARERLLRTIDVAAGCGARSIVMTTGGRGALGWREAAERFAEAMAPCAEAARAAGIALGIEPTSHLYADASIAHRLSDTAALARKAGIETIIDLFACWVDADIDEAIAAAAPTSPLVQIADYVLGDRGLPCRAVPGDGAIPLDRLVPAIVRAGFAGWFDLEIIGPRLQAEGQEAGLRRAAARIGALVGEERS
jgi:sugar phosphate isomerase/epimerase